MQTRKKLIMLTNLLLICVMVIHIGIKWYLHSSNSMNSAPAHIVIIEAVYYLVPIIIINVINVFLKK